jgi:hypothetical protein
MCRLVPLATLIAVTVAACSKSPNTQDLAPEPRNQAPDGPKSAGPKSNPKPPNPKSAEPIATAFDPNSAENTLAWAIALSKEVDEAPRGNQAARKEALERYTAAIEAEAQGKAVRWVLPVRKVTEDWICVIGSIQRTRGALPFHLGVFDRVHFSCGFGEAFQTSETGFPPVPPKADWLRTTKINDRVIVVTTIGRVAATTGFVAFEAVDARVEPVKP